MLDYQIKKLTDSEKLKNRFELDLKNKYVGGEQWFKKPELWYGLTAFSNPYLTVYSELILLIKNLDKLYSHLTDHTLVFYGLGTGDTEMIVAHSVLSKDKKINIIGIEIQSEFINGFIQSLENISYEDSDYQINFIGLNGLFQDTEKKDLDVDSNKKIHVILGNTIGNFSEKEIFGIINNLMNPNDKLLIGFQTNEKMDTIFKQYSQNKMFNNFIKQNIPNCKSLEWKINKQESQIEAWSSDILVFHSKKKSHTEMIESAKEYGLRNIFDVYDNNSSIQIYE